MNIRNVAAAVAELLVSLPAHPHPHPHPQRRYQLSVNGSGGLSTLDYATARGRARQGFGGALGADYAWYFSSRWGVSAGLEAALFTGKYSLPAFSDSYRNYDGEETFELSYSLTGYSEAQQAILLNIPLMRRSEHGRLYAAAGAKAGVRIRRALRHRKAHQNAAARGSGIGIPSP